MKILEVINKIKEAVNMLRDASVSEDIKENYLKALDRLQSAANETGTMIENYAQKENEDQNISADLVDQMKKSTVYDGIGDEELKAMAEAIISKPKLQVLQEDEFLNLVAGELRRRDPEQLIHEVYSKQEIEKMGHNLVDTESSQVAYQRGLQSLKDLITTPSGLLEIIAVAEAKILDEPSRRIDYLNAYYGAAND
jgi:hypothetical protein